MTRPTAPNYSDPVQIFKTGEEAKLVHLVDLEPWLAQGWSREVPPEEVPPDERSQEVKTTVVTNPAETIQPLESLEPEEGESPPAITPTRKKSS